MRNIPLFKEEYKGFTICDQGYTILMSDSNQTLHAGIRWGWCAVALAVAWSALGLLGLFFGLWYNIPAVVVASLASLGLMMLVYHPKKKKKALPNLPGRAPIAVTKARIRRPRASSTSREKSPSRRSKPKPTRSADRSSEASGSAHPSDP